MRPMSRFAFVLVLVSCLGGLGIGSTQVFAHAEFPDRLATERAQTSDSLLLDQYPDAYAAYSLRKLRSGYDGPAIRVQRGSDNAERDFGFTPGGDLDVAAIESWLSGDDGFVVEWYSQIQGHPSLTPRGSQPPRIAQNGSVHTDENGNPQLYFQGVDGAGMKSGDLPTPVPKQDFTVFSVIKYETDDIFFGLGSLGNRVYFKPSQSWGDEASGSSDYNINNLGITSDRNVAALAAGGDGQGTRAYMNAEVVESTDAYLKESSHSAIQVGYHRGARYTGFMSELVVYPYLATDTDYWSRYEDINAYWKTGPQQFNKEAILPQQFDYQVALYDWLETVSVEDVTLPNDGTMNWDGTYSDIDALADLHQKIKKASATRVVRGAPEWYVLDAGNGKGIEATGDVRLWHSTGNGNKRSWANEPAYLYQLDVPLSDGSSGNPFYQKDALAYRALVLAAVDMMMYDDAAMSGGYASWNDMHGKAMLGWAEAYRWCKDILSTDVQNAFETGFGRFLDRAIEQGARNANTNMDMFHVQAAAEVYMATDDSALQDKAVQMVKRVLFGYTDGALETNHIVGNRPDGETGGVFFPAGYVGENDTPEIYYNGESLYHLTGAYAAVMDRTDGSVPEEWQFLGDVLERAAEWRAYMSFVDVDGFRTGPSGFAGRTSAGEPRTQAGESYRGLTLARETEAGTPFLWLPSHRGRTDYIESTKQDLIDKINYIKNNELNNLNKTVTGQPPTWSGWSPWVKETTYLPREGWFTDLRNIKDDSEAAVPFNRSGYTFNKALGGPPTGNEFWAYKDTDASGEEWGFVVEAQKEQGGYNGWTGGRLEMFWSETGGITIVNRHGKAGGNCSESQGHSTCWEALNTYPIQHVWGENANGRFTSAFGRGALGSEEGPQRTTSWDLQGSPPTVSVSNDLHSDDTYLEASSVISGEVTVENKFEAVSNGVRVTQTLTSNESDNVTELWASIPVYLKDSWNSTQGDLAPTTIEYWTGSGWTAMPDPASGTPSTVDTDALRLGRDFQDGNGVRYTYVSFTNTQTMRLSEAAYSDPYQTGTDARTVHIDLHGNPGTTKTLPAAKSVSYTIQTTDPTTGGGTSSTQSIPLQRGWNLVSASVAPSHTDMDSIFADLSSDTLVVKNDNGQRYRPGEDIDEIGSWDTSEAYSVYVDSEATLTVRGTPVPTSTVALEEGWNWIPYFPASSLPIEEALSSVTDQLVIVKNEAGQAYLPNHESNKLESMEPGEGYKIYVDEQVTLTYPDGSN